MINPLIKDNRVQEVKVKVLIDSMQGPMIVTTEMRMKADLGLQMTIMIDMKRGNEEEIGTDPMIVDTTNQG